MSFSELRDNIEKAKAITDKPLSKLEDHEKDFFVKTEHQRRILMNGLVNFGALEHLYSDLIQEDCLFDFMIPLKKEYNTSNEFAFNCIDINLTASNILPRKVGDWTKNSLKAFDILLLKIANDFFPIPVVKSKNKTNIKERDVYNHFEKQLKKEYQTIGENFNYIYQLRSEFEHLQQVTKQGRRIYKEMSNGHKIKNKRNILSFFGLALKELIKVYRKKYKTGVILTNSSEVPPSAPIPK